MYILDNSLPENRELADIILGKNIKRGKRRRENIKEKG
jgi:hypothetical protein